MESNTTVTIHAGHLSVDNGAKFPLTFFANLAKLLGVPAEYHQGTHYGDDRITFPSLERPVVEELLNEANMLYMVNGEHFVWQNVKTDKVEARLTHMRQVAAERQALVALYS